MVEKHVQGRLWPCRRSIGISSHIVIGFHASRWNDIVVKSRRLGECQCRSKDDALGERTFRDMATIIFQCRSQYIAAIEMCILHYINSSFYQF